MPTCSLHALAHIFGKPVAEVSAWFPSSDRPLPLPLVWACLEAQGCTLVFCLHPDYAHDWRYLASAQDVERGTGMQASCWPPCPFAPAHYGIVREHGQDENHAVAMDLEGRVYDHLQSAPVTLAAYQRVHCVVGVFRPC
jgi:hypothetical protein